MLAGASPARPGDPKWGSGIPVRALWSTPRPAALAGAAPLVPGLRVFIPAPSASWALSGLQAAASVKPAGIIPAPASHDWYLVLPRGPSWARADSVCCSCSPSPSVSLSHPISFWRGEGPCLLPAPEAAAVCFPYRSLPGGQPNGLRVQDRYSPGVEAVSLHICTQRPGCLGFFNFSYLLLFSLAVPVLHTL